MLKKEQILIELEDLARQPGYLCTLAVLVLSDIFVDVGKILAIDWRSRISFREFSLLFGLLVKRPLNRDPPSFDDFRRYTDRTYELLSQLHSCTSEFISHEMVSRQKIKQQQPESSESGEGFRKIIGHGEWMTEGMFYGGSGAYGFQFLDLATKRYKYDAEWLAAKKGLSVKDMATLALELKTLQERKALALPILKNPTHEDACHCAFSVLSFHRNELYSANVDICNSFLNMFSLTPGNTNKGFKHPGSYNQVDSHPLIELGQDEYFMPIWFNLAQSIYESPFYWMLQDIHYEQISFKHRGEATEDICYDFLVNVCGSNMVFKDVKISRLKGQTITDADVLALLGNKAIVVQAKSKKLTELARQGNEDKLRSDFKEGIQKAYEQGLACRNAILDHTAEFISESGAKIPINEAINDVYLICVTSDEYPALTHQVEAYLSKFPSDPFPLVISLFDLEIITHYLSDPFQLFYYVRQRTRLADYFRGDEMSLLAYHLTNKLWPAPNATIVYVDPTQASLIDVHYPVARGHQPRTPDFERLKPQWINDDFQVLLHHLKKRSRHPGTTDGVFFLLDLTGDSADTLMKGIEQIKSRARERGKVQRFTMVLNEGKDGISAVAIPPSEAENIEQYALSYGMARKYDLRANSWLTFGCVIGSADLIDTAAYTSEPWKENRDLEEMAKYLLKDSSSTSLNKEMQKIGRNDPCYCGSGKKYKKCHGQ